MLNLLWEIYASDGLSPSTLPSKVSLMLLIMATAVINTEVISI